jgi:hypothetical protein
LPLTGLWWRYSNPPPTRRVRSLYIYPSGTGWPTRKSKSKIKLTLRPKVGQSVCLGVESTRLPFHFCALHSVSRLLLTCHHRVLFPAQVCFL